MTKIVLFFLIEGFADWEASYALAGVASPEMQASPDRYRVVAVSVDGEPVTSKGGLRVEAEGRFADHATPDKLGMLILPGSDLWVSDAPNIMGAVRELLGAGTPVAAICGATWALAAAGLLDARPHTSNAREYLAQTGYDGGAHYREQPVVVDGDLITASALAPVDFASAIFERLDLYPRPVLDAWTRLFKSGDPRHYGDLMAAAGV